MITEQNIDQYYNDYRYTNYYKEIKDYEKTEQIEAERADMAYEDSLWEE